METLSLFELNTWLKDHVLDNVTHYLRFDVGVHCFHSEETGYVVAIRYDDNAILPSGVCYNGKIIDGLRSLYGRVVEECMLSCSDDYLDFVKGDATVVLFKGDSSFLENESEEPEFIGLDMRFLESYLFYKPRGKD